MARYLLTVEHVPEDCLKDLDSIMAVSHQLLDRFDWGCKDGEHTGWVVLEAQDETTARMFLPTHMREAAKVRRIVKFTADDIKAEHEAAAFQPPPAARP